LPTFEATENLRSKDRGEEKKRLPVDKGNKRLLLNECFVLNPSIISSNVLHSNETVFFVQKPGIGRGIGQQEEDNKCPETSDAPKLKVKTSVPVHRNFVEITNDEEDQFPALQLQVCRQFRNTHGNI
jgi:hypothetical protein